MPMANLGELMPITALKEFLQKESTGGLLIIGAAVLAMLAENSPLEPLYDAWLSTPVGIQFGAFLLNKPLLLWINDGLMAVFFFLIGLEIKREFLAGELSDRSRVILPAIAAAGGMAVPALVYVAFNFRDPAALSGWAIPTATDIAFALGVLSLLGARVPHSLKLFLLTLAVIDDLGAIVIIALFYSGDLSVSSLLVAAGALIALLLINRRGVVRIAPYILIGLVLWVAVLKSGVHATLAGVVLAFFIPLRDKHSGGSPLAELEHGCTPTWPFSSFRCSPSPIRASRSMGSHRSRCCIPCRSASPRVCSSANRSAYSASPGSPSGWDWAGFPTAPAGCRSTVSRRCAASASL